MGHKVSPLVLRIGFIRQWHSRWFAKAKDFPLFIQQDVKIRKFIKSKFKQAAISKIVIERLAEKIRIRIFSARPGIIIGRHGSDIERLRSDLNSLVKNELSIDIHEINNPAWDAQLVAENIALQQEKRIAFRRAVKRAMEQSIASGVKGIRVSCSGRLNGAEMGRRETYKIGSVPLQTLRADIDYGFAEALTTYGLIGVKVWIYKGDVLGKQFIQEETKTAGQQQQSKEQFRPQR
ncbi:MAG: 30S ribosomal protein S3 [Candidatus Omnitrophica bacterium]|jgi:small subunit ribosomal protein S3|nr:30S ribosomal protein S3 [Candidatus Omnitrophota bacterium]MDD5252667.1 30S ribosomal protein S3 [Candidatus Omnitrophota bacterium]